VIREIFKTLIKNSIPNAISNLCWCFLCCFISGLPSVLAGLDESLSDVAARRKYPFELEKAIHNVLFIKHHMQRQDEFDAVNLSFLKFLAGGGKRSR